MIAFWGPGNSQKKDPQNFRLSLEDAAEGFFWGSERSTPPKFSQLAPQKWMVGIRSPFLLGQFWPIFRGVMSCPGYPNQASALVAFGGGSFRPWRYLTNQLLEDRLP